MSNVVEFKRPKAPTKGKSHQLCRSGFHKWQVDNTRPFATHQGQLITHYRCARCGKERTDSR